MYYSIAAIFSIPNFSASSHRGIDEQARFSSWNRHCRRGFSRRTVGHNPQILSYLIQYVGADRVVLGSDYCYDMGYDMPVQVLEKTPAAERSLILGANAAKLLKIQA